MKGRYKLDTIDGEIYSTDDYTLYYWYNQVFRGFDVHIEKDKQEMRRKKAGIQQ